MRGVLPTGFLLAILSSGCWGPPPPSEPTTPAPLAAAGAVPSWVPAPTPAQKALLKPVEHALKTTADRVYPDLARFGYAPSRPLGSAEDALKFTRMVTQVLNDSPRFYVLEAGPPEAANLIAQYGPPAREPDGFATARAGDGGIFELSVVQGADAARAALAAGEKAEAGGELSGAMAAYKEAIAAAPGAPAPRTALAGALRKLARLSEAEAAYKEALAADPTYAPAHLGLAEIAEQRNDMAGARRELIEALAYDPPNKRGLEMAARLGAGGFGGRPAPGDGGWTDAPPQAASLSGRVTPFAIFLDVDDRGAVHVATAKDDAAQIYGGCRAIMRYEPDVRAQLFQQPRETPYYLNVAEEVVCLEAALGAYSAARGHEKPAIPDLDQLQKIAAEDGLSGYVMFEILGQHRPERARTAPADVHRDVARYVERHVLARRAAPRAGIYTAAR